MTCYLHSKTIRGKGEAGRASAENVKKTPTAGTMLEPRLEKNLRISTGNLEKQRSAFSLSLANHT